ncbi:DEAD/DEAH box helicase family protein [bacterium]|nr:DEAD/DEAH box helicase family protein [bacterium]
MNEADTCRKYVVPKLVEAGWDNDPHAINEQRTFTDGRIIPLGNKVRRGKQKRADYLLRYTRDFPIAIVEAKADYKTPAAGLQQAKEYAKILGLSFAYSTNGSGIVEFDYTSGRESNLTSFPAPAELWARLQKSKGLTAAQAQKLLTPYNLQSGKTPRYYQDLAIHRAVEAIVSGKKRVLLTMATGTGKTTTAFQICWKLWSSRWNLAGDHRRPRILYLADRNILVDDPKSKDFAPFGDAAHKIENGKVIKSREIYFAIYQAIAADENRPGLYKEYTPDFFDLIIVDECHRGSARTDSSWREILEYFAPATQLGMTATPLREDNRDSYEYFGNPIYIYSLRQGIEDGFLAPYRVHRVITTADAAGWRPTKGELDRYGREIPDDEYHTKDFERAVALRARTEAIAKHLTEFMKANGRFAKTIVFCVDQEHADEMRQVLNNLNQDLAQQHPDYVCRVTADEGEIGKGHLSRFQELETTAPVILTTSQLLTTGVDAPMVRNIALARVVGSMNEFKQILGRGTRVRDDYDKLFFTILDYTGSASRHFADPDFDGEPARIEEIRIDDEGSTTASEVIQPEASPELLEYNADKESLGGIDEISDPAKLRKFYVDGGSIEIAHEVVWELDADGKRLRVIRYTDYIAEKVRTMFPAAAILRQQWADAYRRSEIIEQFEQKGIDFEALALATKQHDADPFDLLCHVAFNAPLRTRRERADRLRQDKKDFFEQYGSDARAILNDLLDKYTEHGYEQFAIPEILQVPPISERGNVSEIIGFFGGADKLKAAVAEMQTHLYAA